MTVREFFRDILAIINENPDLLLDERKVYVYNLSDVELKEREEVKFIDAGLADRIDINI